MNKEDKQEFLNIINKTAIMFDKEVNTFLLDGYWDILKQYTIDEVKQAFNDHCRKSKFFPRPAEIIELITGGEDLEAIATKEATKVLQAVRRIGGYKSVVFDDPVTNAVVARGFAGWVKLCDEALEEHNKWFIKDFIKLYMSYHSTGIKQIEHIPGIAEGMNTARGFDTEGPVMISDNLLTGTDDIKQISWKSQ